MRHVGICLSCRKIEVATWVFPLAEPPVAKETVGYSHMTAQEKQLTCDTDHIRLHW
jgi:hypothetical protein